ncbi:MAG: glutamine--fructose-6-phosphate transaminase (isomerizing) [Holosporales bacterium]|jgi:glucosamine--fructose-6-phosphate aminotransferase (isomerizing)|nr:glutamine--fructose-6-phosphate transaminase (isomerizing) [Holosporales bacterium]
MCGIISILSLDDDGVNDILGAMERLEYRGYDSSGIAWLASSSKLQRIRSVGKIAKLKDAVATKEARGHVWIGHTRWATHGLVTEHNAHPHVCDDIAIVHNGIIENYQALRNELLNAGYEFESETDSEVIAVLIASYIKGHNLGFEDACRRCMATLSGTFAIAAICGREPDVLIGMKVGSPMAIGIDSEKRNFYIASDAIAMSSLSDEITYLEEGDFVVATKSQVISYRITNSAGADVQRVVEQNKVQASHICKDGHESFMLKEIFEEAMVARKTYDEFDPQTIDISRFSRVSLIACGTSYYACLLAKYWFEDIANTPADVEVASEFRYRNPVFTANTLYVFVSQSGETIDTLYALRLAKERGSTTLAIVNVECSSIAREADIVIVTPAGPEIGVASTKTFTAQIMTLLLMCMGKDAVDISSIENSINAVIEARRDFEEAAQSIKMSRSVFYVGRGPSYPLALEGALKMKELSYINAEGYPAGEIKHGPIALIDESVCTVVMLPYDKYFDKTLSNTQEILARNGNVLLLISRDSQHRIRGISNHPESELMIGIPQCTESTGSTQQETDCGGLRGPGVRCLLLPATHSTYSPFVLGTAIHLLAYYTAKTLDHDVDKPRNLAKSVTVE